MFYYVVLEDFPFFCFCVSPINHHYPKEKHHNNYEQLLLILVHSNTLCLRWQIGCLVTFDGTTEKHFQFLHAFHLFSHQLPSTRHIRNWLKVLKTGSTAQNCTLERNDYYYKVVAKKDMHPNTLLFHILTITGSKKFLVKHFVIKTSDKK